MGALPEPEMNRLDRLRRMVSEAIARFRGMDETGETDYWGRGGLAGMLGMDPWHKSSPQEIAEGFVGSTTPKVGKALLSAASKPIRAYHGSPHDFDKFDLSKIGTGEGAQAYGHGLYFAESPGVAKSYRDMLTKYAPNIDGVPILEAHADGSLAKRIADKVGLPRPESIEAANAVAEAQRRGIQIRDLMTERAARAVELHGPEEAQRLTGLGQKLSVIDTQGPPGRMYEVDIHADPSRFLDWDKPLAEQSGDVAGALRGSYGDDFEKLATQLYSGNRKMTGGEFYRNYLNAARHPRTASSDLAEATGIPGIKYLDQGSRYHPSALPDNPLANEARQFLTAAGGDSAAARKLFNESNPVKRFGQTERDEVLRVIEAAGNKQTSNYVVFDDSLISILRKYGLAGLIGGGAAAEALPAPESMR